MQANQHNSRGACQRCGRVQGFVLACAFNADGSFRFLCAHCERMEAGRNQLRLFACGAPRIVPAVVEPEPEPEPIPVRAQMSLWGD